MHEFVCCFGAALALWAAPAPAAACSCAATTELLWPAIGASDVSTQPDIVIYRAWGPPSPVGVELRGPDGVLVPLRERASPNVQLSDFCNARLVFLESEQPLTANTRYELSFPLLDPNLPLAALVPPPRAFTTGAVAQEAAPPAALELHPYRLSSSTGMCSGMMYESCDEIMHVDLGGPAVSAGEPFWFRLSAPLRGMTETLTLSVPGTGTYAPRGAIAMDKAAPCVAWERVDVRGSVIGTGELCSPEKCARYGHYAVRTGKHSCFGVNELEAAVWDQVGSDSCAHPPLIERDLNTDIVSVSQAAPAEEPDAGAQDASTHGSASTPDANAAASASAIESAATQNTSSSGPPASAVEENETGATARSGRAAKADAGCSLAPAPRSVGAGIYCALALLLLATLRRASRRARAARPLP